MMSKKEQVIWKELIFSRKYVNRNWCRTRVFGLALLLGSFLFMSALAPTLITQSSISVVYGQNDVPIFGAIVSAWSSQGDGFATTDASGMYSISEGLQTGDYTVTVTAMGYIIEEQEGVSVTVGEATSNVDVYLRVSGGISGLVSDAISGAPVANVLVTAFSSDEQYGWFGLTDANGNYIIATNLATGTYNVTAFFPEGYVTGTVSGVGVTEGMETSGINLSLEYSGVLSGVVTALDGTPLVNATVMVSSQNGVYFGFATTDVSGNYRISSGLGTGTYDAFALYELGFAQVTDISVVAGEETSNVNFVIDVPPPTPSGGISGIVTDNQGNPLQGVIVTATGVAGFGSATTDIDGDYLIADGLSTGTYTVEASATGFISSTTLGVEVIVSQETQNVNFQLNRIPPTASGTILGTVSGDANPLITIEESTLTCNLSQQTVPVGSSVTVSGTINPGVSALVTIQISKDEGATWVTLTTITSASDGTYSHAWTPQELGSYQVRTFWLGDAEYFGATSPSTSLSVTKRSSEISCSVSPQGIQPDETITVSGSITPIVEGITVTLTYTKPDSTTFERTVTTTSSGAFTDSYKVSAEGSWSVKVSWTGDAQLTSASSSKAFTVKKESDCIIATATYGSELNPNVQFLRSFRDDTILSTFTGSSFMTVFNEFYYSFSPSVASVIADNSPLRDIMKVVLYPLIGILQVSSAVFSVFSFSPELGVVIAGSVASSLIGVTYFLPLALILSFFKKFKVSAKIPRLTGLIWACSIATICVAEISKSPLMMMVATGAFVLITITTATLTSLRIISKRLIH